LCFPFYYYVWYYYYLTFNAEGACGGSADGTSTPPAIRRAHNNHGCGARASRMAPRPLMYSPKIKNYHALDDTHSSPYRVAAWLHGLEYWRDYSHPVYYCRDLSVDPDHSGKTSYLSYLGSIFSVAHRSQIFPYVAFECKNDYFCNN
jgi:hypothetical protein